jgi:4-hydroxybenzoate polyprenyltransferase
MDVLRPIKFIGDFIVFTSIFIAFCAIMMVHETNHLLQLNYNKQAYFYFVFFSTLCSYNFHWWLTPGNDSEMIRMRWTREYKQLHLILFVTGLTGAIWFFFYFIQDWFWMGGAGLLTFLYSAPKLPYKFAGFLKRIAIGKTIFLAMVWTYVTTALPVLLAHKPWNAETVLFCSSKFFLIYSICILFDYRDRDYDKKEGIRSLITYFDEKEINLIFYVSVLLYAFFTVSLSLYRFSPVITALLLLPGFVLLLLYRTAKRNFSDYLYYVVLDGLMMFSALFTSFVGINYF